MNKRPLPGAGLGLPSKPYIPPPAPGPAPPLPAGPPPPQPAYPQQDPSAAHAAAWAAYYQSQGASTGAAYTAPAQPQPQSQPQAHHPQPASGPIATNPYANYGYGAGAQHSSPAGHQPQQPVAGPSQPYRPPQNAQPYASTSTQPVIGQYGQQSQGQAYNPQAPVGYQAQGYQPPQPQQPPQPGYGQGQQPYGGWQGPQHQQNRPPQPQQQFNQPQPYRAPQQNQPYHSHQPQAQQPYYPPQPLQPQHQLYNPAPQTQPYRPAPSSAPMAPQNRPYQSQPQHRPSPTPPRPPIPNLPRPPVQTPPHLPPAKRPRFDGPGGGMNGGVGMGMQNPRPPTGPPVRPGYNGPGPINMGQPGFNVRPVSAGPMRGGAPGQRPPIHLGRGGPPPALGFGGAPMRGVLADRVVGGRGVGIMPNVPRGPSGMRRPEPTRPSRARDSARGEREKERRKRDKGPEIKTTMTDFRIVGIEMKELGWSWGMVGVEDEVRKENGDASIEPTVEEDGSAVPDGEQDKKTGEEEEEAAVKSEPAESETADGVEEKRGEKRKAKTPDGGEHLVDPLAIRLIDLDDEAGSASKKRPSDYLLTHGKPNDTPPSTSHESNQNRFRIYFESPPELDRIPKAARRNPNKRWRRESSSVAPSRMGDGREETVTVDERAETATIDERAETATVDEVLEEVAGEDGTPVPQAGGETESAEVVAEESAEAQPEEAEAPADVETDSPEVVAAVEPVGEVEPGVATKVEVAPTEAVEVSAAVQLPAIIPAVNQGSPVEVETLAVDVEPPAVDVEAPAVDVEAPAVDVEPPAVDVEPPAVDVETPAVEAAETTDPGMEAADTAAEAAPVSSETVEASGDISMVIDSSAIAALISELVDSTAEATTLAGSDVLKNGDAATETGEAPPAGRTDGAEKPFANGETEASIKPDEQASSELTVAEASAAELEAALAKSAENTASAYKSRTRRRSSVSSVDSQDGESVSGSSAQIGVPSMNRLSILYEDSSRRLCFDAAVVEKVRIFREEGKIEVILSSAPEAGNPVKTEPSEGENGTVDEKPFGERSKPSSLKGILVEMYDHTDQRFVSVCSERLTELWSDPPSDITVPPFHCASSSSSEGLTLTVYLNKKRPLSEPKWCRTDQADDWLLEQFGSRKGSSDAGWRGKLEIMDPDPAPTLRSILDSWASSSTTGSPSDRRNFTSSLLSDPNDLLEILLRLTRGDRNPTVPLATSIRPDSPYASHQTHVSLAILAMYRLTTDYAAKAGEKSSAVNEKMGDIIKSLPVGMIHKSLDGLFKEWVAEKK